MFIVKKEGSKLGKRKIGESSPLARANKLYDGLLIVTTFHDLCIVCSVSAASAASIVRGEGKLVMLVTAARVQLVLAKCR